ncbi:MAG: hypothetical protein M3Z21_03525 [Pseudomonadota bacterium]|nr:hypothetical protein [Pseudomonadota bacterium]
MHIGSDERGRIARLFRFLAAGEECARDCARAQAAIAPQPALRRFLLAQARQEAFHARLFGGGVALLAPRGVCRGPGLEALARFRREAEAAIAQGDFAASLLAIQVVLEGLGEATLTAVDAGMEQRRCGFRPIRALVLRQERGHHAFGVSRLRQLVEDGTASRALLAERGDRWLHMGEGIMAEMADYFAFFDEDPQAYAAGVRRALRRLTEQ